MSKLLQVSIWILVAMLAFDAHAGITLVRAVPVTADSQIYGAANVPGSPLSVDLARRGYLEEEYFISGTADAYGRDATDQLQVVHAAVPYTTRIVVRRPQARSRFSGTVVIEPIHPLLASTLAWSATAEWLIRSGHIYVAIGTGNDPPTRATSRAGTPVAADLVAKWFDPLRYQDFNWPAEDGVRWQVLSDIATLLQGNAATSPLSGYGARHLLATGWSFTGSFLRTYINEGFHERARTIDGGPVMAGYLIGISSRWNRSGYLPLNSSSEVIPLDHPRRAAREIDVPVIEFITANEVAGGTGPQAADKDERNGGHRFYELGATSHSDSFMSDSGRAARTTLTQLRNKGYPLDKAGIDVNVSTKCPLATSDVPIGEYAMATLDNLDRWVRTGIAPPRAAPLQLNAEGGFTHDTQGNPLGGIRIAEFDVPRARYDTLPADQRQGCVVAAGRMPFYRLPLSAEQLGVLYSGRVAYLRAYEQRTRELVKQRWLLQPEATRLIDKARRAATALPLAR